MTQQLTQYQIVERERRNIAGVNEEFCWLARNGMTRGDLQRNIERRPQLWGRFAGFLNTLPVADPRG